MRLDDAWRIVMVKCELLADSGILLITPDGLLQKADFERFAALIDPYIAANGKLTGILIKAESFPGWDGLEAMTAHFNFVAAHHQAIQRIAIVTNNVFLKTMPHIAGLLVRPEIKAFGVEENDKAMAWLATGQ